ncbi:MAG: hypothetical protein ACXABG_13630 [Promethearchaeota archaeon]|jgi:hypothetical protein
MSRRYYAKGKKTYAKDQSFEQDQLGEEKERYLISIDLMSLKTLKDYDLMGWRGEFYFKVEGEKVFKARWPNKGFVKLQRNQNFTSKADMNIWSQFKTVRAGKEAIVRVEVFLREQDHMKRNEDIAKEKYDIVLPSKTKYVILQDDKEQTKAKLRIQASRTRY